MKTHKKVEPIPEEVIAQVHLATGSPVSSVIYRLENASPQIYSRIVEAAYTNRPNEYKLLYDPIEDTPEYKAVIKDVAREAREKQQAQKREYFKNRRGNKREASSMWSHAAGHVLDSIKKRILFKKHQIEWYSMYEMNPGRIPH